jgi:hypothetical protein
MFSLAFLLLLLRWRRKPVGVYITTILHDIARGENSTLAIFYFMLHPFVKGGDVFLILLLYVILDYVQTL